MSDNQSFPRPQNQSTSPNQPTSQEHPSPAETDEPDLTEEEKATGPTSEPPPRDWVLLLKFSSYAKPYWKWVLFSVLAIPFTVGTTMAFPWLIVKIVDDYIVPGNLEGLYLLIAILAGTVLTGYVADGVYSFSLQKAGQLSIASLREDLYAHTLQLPRSFYDHHPVGVLLSRLTSDTEALGESLAAGVVTIFTDIIKTIALFGLLLYFSWELTLVIVAILPPIYFLSNFLRNKLRYYYNRTRETLADSTGFLQECLNGIQTVQLYAAEKKVQHRYEEKTQLFLQAQTKSNFYDAALFSVIEGITTVCMALIIWYGSKQILGGVITIGVLIGFLNTLHKIFVPIREFTQQISAIQRALAALQHINQLFQELPEEARDTIKPEWRSRLQNFESLEFDNVYFRYSDQAPYILKGVSFRLEKGDRLAIVGTTGSGKSTILRILTKTYTNYQGSIKLNGIELGDIPRSEIWHLMALMQQDVYLFNESIAFNIGLDRPQVQTDDIQKAAEYVYADSFIDQLEAGYDFELLENGKNLSAGQAQLVSFARAIAGKSELMLLDEATSAIDSVTENLIQKATEKILDDKTVIAIAHRLSTIQHSDNILVMQAGNIVEQGNHQELMVQQGVYANLVQNLEGAAN